MISGHAIIMAIKCIEGTMQEVHYIHERMKLKEVMIPLKLVLIYVWHIKETYEEVKRNGPSRWQP